MSQRRERNVCFVTGTRAEFGLMEMTLARIAREPRLNLQIIATGMHLDRSLGRSLDAIARSRFCVNKIVPWKSSGGDRYELARQTGKAVSGVASALQDLASDIVLVVGDRVEALAGAMAGHLSGRVVAHVHGGDRALGQTDDSVRHAISKLAHIHFPATRQSERRLRKMGEDRWRIHCVGSPALDGIHYHAGGAKELQDEFPGLELGQFALLVLHAVDADEALEKKRAGLVLNALRRSGVGQIVIVYPNNDPGSRGIARCWDEIATGDIFVRKNLSRTIYLGLLRECAFLAGNSSSGIIEAASFRKGVIDIGPRQQGRERSGDVASCGYRASEIAALARAIFNAGKPLAGRYGNLYGEGRAGEQIAEILRHTKIHSSLLRKSNAY